MKKLLIVYHSLTGGTQQMAEAAAAGARGEAGVQVLLQRAAATNGDDVLAGIAFDPARDRGLAAIDAGHLFGASIIHLVMRRHAYLSRHASTFVTMFAPHISKELLGRAIDGGGIDRAKLAREAPVATAGL